MGYYTELVLSFMLKEDTPNMIINTLKYMIDCNAKVYHDNLDDKFLDVNNGCKFMLCSSSYYFAYPAALSDIHYNDITRTHHVSIRCSLKNYYDEIDTFLTWITPYIKSQNENFLGFYIAEDAKEPTLIYMSD